MANKSNKRTGSGGIVFSTNPNFDFGNTYDLPVETVPPEKQKLIVILDKKHRKGKIVTLITGFVGDDNALKELEKKLKTLCGSGGSSKDSEILIQGDFKQKILDYLLKNGYNVK
ncbi:MAG: translation initiation factor [Marinilabiliaceae bacterium]|nr:translation initiation factor [Marinilabiliaceae bacterium]